MAYARADVGSAWKRAGRAPMHYVSGNGTRYRVPDLCRVFGNGAVGRPACRCDDASGSPWAHAADH